MTEHEHNTDTDMTKLTAKIVSAYVSKNAVPVGELPALVRSTYAALSGLNSLAWRLAAKAQHPSLKYQMPSAAQIRCSVRPDGLVSFIDCKIYKTLKRHLAAHGLHPKSYRERYGLPPNYPMVAHNYAELRSQIAKSIGLGRAGGQVEKLDAAERPRKGRRGVPPIADATPSRWAAAQLAVQGL
ncbi:MAG: MucR family transcriptional regulator [Methylobacterium sp.]|uniref:MucR family transcriptional regulator n=1 Tax=Methylobacterium sp. TaxID=409 RepID=UPI000FA3B90D|nr:MucR family transcriptional regulator [Methylobacterium sp.]RUP15263.1 MAG: MucR family transcriptional regulator [Methylobacterium sp.]